jgi:dsRNA-specific ribonuclease
MDPRCIKFLANITENLKFPQSESKVFHLKIFDDVLEALLGAVFIDSGCDLNITKKVFINFFKPYLYILGNMETV